MRKIPKWADSPWSRESAGGAIFYKRYESPLRVLDTMASNGFDLLGPQRGQQHLQA